ncbi:MAG TPA: gamma-glutamylcyclotransferase family protein [bacterium]|nr:gamma-glutamylcyclotransferase family protein [bacterium]
MFYFAYGSNLDFEQMHNRCPSAVTIAMAILPEHRLAFTRFSEARNGGVADIVPAQVDHVQGALYDITDDDAVRLDGFEGVSDGCYERITVKITLRAGEVLEAYTYKASEQGLFKPSKAYMQQIITGARYHQLDSTYIAMLEALETAD